MYGEHGVPQNLELALKLCKLACAQGLEDARFQLLIIQAALEPRTCGACATVEPKVRTYQKCNACRVVYYCGAECQRAHWKAAHKHECSRLKGEAEAEKRGVFASMCISHDVV